MQLCLTPVHGERWRGYNVKYTNMGTKNTQAGMRTKIPKWVSTTLVLTGVIVGVLIISASFFVREANDIIVSYADPASTGDSEDTSLPEIIPFPVSVNPEKKEIAEDPALEEFVVTTIPKTDGVLSVHSSWFSKVLGKLALMGWYQNLASLSTRVLVIEPGERKEQIVEHFAKILKWSSADRETFLSTLQKTSPVIEEGKMFPGAYNVAVDASPEYVAQLVAERFDAEVLSRYTPEIEMVVPLQDTLIVASLLEREARDFDDMRHISGVIWNRLFVDMKLQIDATLQYAKGSKPSQPWWPRVLPADKYLASAYNTYKNEGLPPAPIANPSLEAIIGALNPVETDCMFYFHDKKGGFHCTKTYEEHVKLLKQYYGRGK